MTCFATEENVGEVSSVPGGIRVETISVCRAFLDPEAVWNEVAEAAGLDHPFLEHAFGYPTGSERSMLAASNT